MPGPNNSAPNQHGARGVGTQKSGWGARACAEIALMAVGVALLAAFCGAHIDSYLSSRAALKAFLKQRSAALDSAKVAATRTESAISGAVLPTPLGTPSDSPGEHRPGRQNAQPAAVAVLRIPRIHLEVPVLEGTDAVTLHRGAGWIKGTTRPGERGNTGIAGHRDSFFRGLKDLKMNDTLNLETPHGNASYVVDHILIVKPEDVSVLNPTPEPVLTLVTCYPFRFVGSAPKRYVVTARLLEAEPDGLPPAAMPDPSLASHLSQIQ